MRDVYELLVWLAQGVIVLFIGFVVFERMMRRQSRRENDRDAEL